MHFSELSKLAKEKIPFLFISDFLAQKIEVFPLSSLKDEDIEYSIDHFFKVKKHPYTLSRFPQKFELYKKKFDRVIERIKAGDTYLLNLTQATKVEIDTPFKDLFSSLNAPYKLRYKDQFLCFSPEKFIQIDSANTIHTFPMKGTIDASITNAKELILANEKEMAEHVMVVDLLRNDLSRVALDVKVKKFRYIEEIEAGEKKLLQVSSHICGSLEQNWHERLGEILEQLLPAGSISGTPKKSTLEIIKDVEGYDRGFFSGVFGVYDGKTFDSGVMIRFLEKTQDGYLYKSGGGITLESDAMSEYNELLDKIYLP